MKKTLYLFLVCVLASCLFPRSSSAAPSEILCGFCPELCGGTSGNRISNGEFFKCNPLGGNEFRLCKNSGCVNYEQFRYGNEAGGSYIYHVYDVPWSYSEGGAIYDEKCTNTGEKADGVRFDPGIDPFTGVPGMKWVDQNMTVGTNFNPPGSGYVIGKGVTLNQICQTRHSGPIDHGMQLAYRGCIKFPTGVISLDTLEFHITGGGGVGEQFFYNLSQKKGWIGFNRGTANSGAYVVDPIDTIIPPGVTCKEITIQAGNGSPFFNLPSGCNLSDPGDQTSRPVACQACNQTDKMIPDCASSFTVSSQVSFLRGEGQPCTSDGNTTYWVERDWGGNITVNASDTRIPFVGKKGEEDDRMYLADYYEGTHLYYHPVCNPKTDPQCVYEAVTNGGVWRKLASPELQDTFKRNLVQRVLDSKNGLVMEGALRDYLVVYQVPDGPIYSAQISEIANHLPPQVNEGNYSQKYLAWKDSDNRKWFYLWAATPMFSREDTVGRVMPYLGRNQYDQFIVQDPATSTIERVPHLARLYEVTSAINKLILPSLYQASNTVGMSDTSQSLAANETKSKLLAYQGTGPVLLAEARPGLTLVPNASYANGQVSVIVDIDAHGCDGHFYFYSSAGGGLLDQCCIVKDQVYSVYPQWNGSPISLTPNVPVTVTYSAHISKSNGEGCEKVSGSATCTFSVNSAGVFSTNCNTGPVLPPGPYCGPFPVQSVNDCSKDADTGYGDPICCGPININLQAKDNLLNDVYKPCYQCETDLEGNLIDAGCDDCNETVNRTVQRRIGVALSHPYLKQIWENTTDISTGLLNYFRLNGQPAYIDKEAKDTIQYSGLNADPPVGDFYYPYLGGIQRSKEYTIKTLEQYGQPN